MTTALRSLAGTTKHYKTNRTDQPTSAWNKKGVSLVEYRAKWLVSFFEFLQTDQSNSSVVKITKHVQAIEGSLFRRYLKYGPFSWTATRKLEGLLNQEFHKWRFECIEDSRLQHSPCHVVMLCQKTIFYVKRVDRSEAVFSRSKFINRCGQVGQRCKSVAICSFKSRKFIAEFRNWAKEVLSKKAMEQRNNSLCLTLLSCNAKLLWVTVLDETSCSI